MGAASQEVMATEASLSAMRLRQQALKAEQIAIPVVGANAADRKRRFALRRELADLDSDIEEHEEALQALRARASEEWQEERHAQELANFARADELIGHQRQDGALVDYHLEHIARFIARMNERERTVRHLTKTQSMVMSNHIIDALMGNLIKLGVLPDLDMLPDRYRFAIQPLTAVEPVAEIVNELRSDVQANYPQQSPTEKRQALAEYKQREAEELAKPLPKLPAPPIQVFDAPPVIAPRAFSSITIEAQP